MVTILSISSIASMVLQNGLFNSMCKNELKTNDHKYRFNMIMYAVCILLFAIGLINGEISLFTVLLGVVFGVVTALSNLYKMRALSDGPMHITLLITTSSMIIPAISGVFFAEAFSIYKLLVMAALLGFIYLSFDKKKGERMNGKWLLCVSLAFVLQGSIGVLQKVHQASEHKSELSAFLFVAFLCSLAYSRIRAKSGFKALGFGKKHVLFGIACGVCTYLMNIINLHLSGVLPSQLFFPLINGSAIILSSLTSIFIFKERITKKQLVGLVGGIASLVAICLVN